MKAMVEEVPGEVEGLEATVGEQRFRCQCCDKQFRTQVQLKRHMNVHLSPWPYSCAVCSKTLTQPDHLSVHSRTHSGSPAPACPYVCSVCGRTFIIVSNMRKHTTVHNRDTDGVSCSPLSLPLPAEPRPFLCTHCGASFHVFERLGVHEKRDQHIRCQGCDGSFNLKQHLKKHSRLHTNSRPKGKLPAPSGSASRQGCLAGLSGAPTQVIKENSLYHSNANICSSYANLESASLVYSNQFMVCQQILDRVIHGMDTRDMLLGCSSP